MQADLPQDLPLVVAVLSEGRYDLLARRVPDWNPGEARVWIDQVAGHKDLVAGVEVSCVPFVHQGAALL